MSADAWLRLVEHALWPIVVLVLIIVLRRPIGDLLSTVGSRVTKVSVLSVELELAVATEAAPPWKGAGGEDIRGLVPAHDVNDSYFDTLRQALEVTENADYFIVDLKQDGRMEWLTSRLYLFTYLLSRVKGVRSVVFTATRGDVARTYLGVAGSEDLLRVLAAAQPWLYLARLQVEAQHLGRLPELPPPDAPTPAPVELTGPEDPDRLWARLRSTPYLAPPLSLSQQFLQYVQWMQPPGATDPESGWLRLPDLPGQTSAIWEHAQWIAASDLTDGILRDAVRSDGFVLDDRSWSPEARVRAVAQAPSDQVALLGPDRRFERLVDRRSLLVALGVAAAREAVSVG